LQGKFELARIASEMNNICPINDDSILPDKFSELEHYTDKSLYEIKMDNIDRVAFEYEKLPPINEYNGDIRKFIQDCAETDKIDLNSKNRHCIVKRKSTRWPRQISYDCISSLPILLYQCMMLEEYDHADEL